MDDLVVHFRFKDKILCGVSADPSGWPQNHRWTEDPDTAAKKVTCPGCKAERDRRIAAKAASSGG